MLNGLSSCSRDWKTSLRIYQGDSPASLIWTKCRYRIIRADWRWLIAGCIALVRPRVY
uniref:Uncharacterized protein n=1 Tax=Anguilla anguilla TaxID=7936 RepID=A0A0E9VAN3_ANGAN